MHRCHPGRASAHWPLVVSDGGTDAGGRQGRSGALAWGVFGLAVSLMVIGEGLHLATLSAPATVGYGVRGIEVVIAVPVAITGLIVARRRPDNPIGWLQLASSVLLGLNLFTEAYAVAVVYQGWDLPAAELMAWTLNWLWIVFIGLLAIFVLLLFPTGALPSRRWRPVAWLGAIGMAVGTIAIALTDGPLENFEAIDNPIGVGGFGPDQSSPLLSPFLLAILLATASLFVRLRGARGEVRQQLKVMLYAAVLCAVALLVNGAVEGVFGTAVDTSGVRVIQGLVVIGLGAIPVAAGIAVLRHGLYEIDVVISKTLVYGLLAAFITVIYAVVVAGASAIAGTSDNRWLPLVAAALVAVAFQPARERVQRVADRLVYGDRASPYEVLASFSSQIGTTFATEDQLAEMARLLGEGTGAVRADVHLVVSGEERPGATWPPDAPAGLEPDLRVPVVHQGEQLGVLAVAKSRNDPLTAQDEKLTVDLAAQAGIALRNVGLTRELLARVEELRASRQRLVTAQDEERRRIERDLHDGAQQQLVALKIKLGLARMQAEDEGAPETAAQLADLAAEAGEALQTLRDLAHGIYPPLLAADGLVAALEGHARKSSLPVEVEADDRGRRYPAEVEVAAYYCCLEALQNASKYAEATSVCVELRAVDDALEFAVRDDGRGFDAGQMAAGAGVRNMTDRVDALAGTLDIESAPGRGTTVRGRLPCR